MSQVTVREVMNRSPATIAEDSDVRRAVEIVASGVANDLMVLDADGRFVGLLAEGDILRSALPNRDVVLAAGGSVEDGYRAFLRRGRELSAESIKPLVIRRPVLVSPDDHIAKIATIFVDLHMRTLAVLEDGRLVGSVSRADLCRGLVGHRSEPEPR
jgi:CBS-domain-containing membrane protein